MARPRNDVQAEMGAEPTVIVEPKTDMGFYHYGLLPAQGETRFPVQRRDQREMTLEKMDAYDLWNDAQKVGLEKGIRIFVAKARQFFGLSVRGFHFPSINQFVEMGQDTTARAPYPGGVARLLDEEVRRVARYCFRFWLHYPNGVGKADDPTQAVDIRDDEIGRKPAEWSDADWSAYKINHPTPTAYTFNPKHDRYIAELVYLCKLPNDPDSIDLEDYAKNPNKFHYQMVGPVTREFFQNPPKSVAETYTTEGLPR